MKTLVVLIFTSLGGWLGWWLGAFVSTGVAFVVSTVLSGVGLYYARIFGHEYLD